MPIVNNPVLYTYNFIKRVDLMLCALSTNKKARGQQKSFGSDGCIYYFHCGDGATSVCICTNSSRYIC